MNKKLLDSGRTFSGVFNTALTVSKSVPHKCRKLDKEYTHTLTHTHTHTHIHHLFHWLKENGCQVGGRKSADFL